MKTSVFFGLALAALLLGLRQDPPQRHGRAEPRDPDAAVRPVEASAAPAPPRQEADAGGAAAPLALPPALGTAGASAEPATGRPARGPAGGPLPEPGPGVDETPGDWRDSALDLLSQIGLLCPSAGCDSLEDD